MIGHEGRTLRILGVGLVALVVGLASGVVVLRVGVGWGGWLLDRRWPEVLEAVSERTG